MSKVFADMEHNNELFSTTNKSSTDIILEKFKIQNNMNMVLFQYPTYDLLPNT